ncbi:spore germination protein [Ammoniphilus sp. CFH 90114]|uniref:spore germination protein n=1 Tax=Ammoniphilus sp. CFH 90114 TaxID=2493665 RepID=UPI00100DD7A5|nr:spore germination protein [Ammoniphilus sp. CFH 90114]RXT03998.1 spore germination protein [Ammoniphilus sp. CFH 90114]
MRRNVFRRQKKSKSKTYTHIGISSDVLLLHRLEDNLEMIKQLFHDCSDVVYRELTLQPHVQGVLIYIDGMVDSDMISDHALTPLLFRFGQQAVEPDTRIPNLLENGQSVSQVSEAKTVSEAVNAILTGNAVLLVQRFDRATILSVRGGTRRGVQEPNTESVIRGPREGFSENLRTNSALIRFRLKSPQLKMVPFVLGEHTQTNIALAYMEGLADPDVIKEVTARIKDIKIDGVLETGYLEELIEDDPYSPFPQVQYSERPDTIAGQLLEGRFVILVDGTPFALSGPVTAVQFLQASEDYYERYMIVNLIRWLRYIFLFISLLFPAIYVAVITYHHDMLPTNLIYTIAATREAIPFPALIEALIMEVAFEALREAGIRLPKTVGQAVSILGALVIGQAAVEAGIVSAPMVIIVSITGIASFTIPRFNFAITVRMLRFPIMILAGVFGLYGIIIAMMWIIMHMCSLRSFGVPYMSGFAPLNLNELKDTFLRVPWWKMNERPSTYTDQENRQRMATDMKPEPPTQGKKRI